MKTRKRLENENMEKIMQLFELGGALNWFSSDNTPFRFEDFMGEETTKEVSIDGVKITKDDIRFVDDMYVYTKDYQMICPSYEEWKKLREIL